MQKSPLNSHRKSKRNQWSRLSQFSMLKTVDFSIRSMGSMFATTATVTIMAIAAFAGRYAVLIGNEHQYSQRVRAPLGTWWGQQSEVSATASSSTRRAARRGRGRGQNRTQT
jgi:hypothetical protein